MKGEWMLIQIHGLTEEEIYKLAEISAEGFKDNPGFLLWGDDSNSRKYVLTQFFNIVLETLAANKMVYATSENYEGICAFWTKKTRLNLKQKFKMLKLIKYFSIRRLAKLSKQFSGMKRAEHFVKEDDDYLFIFMVVVQEQYRHQGYMRKMMEFLFGEAEKRNIPCILETDSKRNAEIYSYYGMKTESVQQLSSELTYYILKR
ncbi:GNAT family N-acetyltransferase [Paenibacillus sp. D2_2]|uniref:GNAT family N-acetyltransferase n=1 Tax=Paenibacillus sp. D2_2 TaxID=3073092 RepID=UPI002814DC36|nr:GNAT family N-acetyltransferase [Paenibacillus sp. D2_2]WMT42771.1 GNAT family N-acetyltransferase [Paenibacillus sp. D2_2]